MTAIPFLILCATHWVADFVLQTDWQAQNKSKRWDALLSHTGIYSMVITALIALIFDLTPVNLFLFLGITFICHTATDYVTSRINSKLWADKKVHWFFVSVGFDQLLHYAQLFLTYELLR